MANLSLVFDILAKDRASKEFNKVGDAADSAGKKGGKFGPAIAAGAAVAAAAIVGFGASAVRSAGEAEQSLGGVQAVFGNAASKVEEFSARSGKSIGLAGQDYQQLAAIVGSQLQRMGQSQDESAVSTDKLITLGADLAATFGGSVSDAVSAVGSLLRGERDPIERYGVGINDAAIKARLLKDGLGDLTGAALEQAKGQATLKLLTEQTTNAQGQAERESKTLQGQTARLGAQYKDLTADIGAKLLPVILGAIEKFGSFTQFLERNKAIVVPLTVAVAAFTIGIVAVNAAVKAYTAVQAALNVVLAANPIVLVVAALALLAAGLVIAYKKSETFRDIVNGAFSLVLTGVDKLLGGIQALFGALGRVPGFGWAKTAADAIGSARKQVQGLAADINNVPSYKRVVVDYQQVGSITSVPYRARATGGSIAAGKPYMVGERGPEMIVPSRSGFVLSASQTASLGGGDSAAEVRALRGDVRALVRDFQRVSRQAAV